MHYRITPTVPTDTTYVSPSRVRRKSHHSCPTKLIHRSSAPTQRIHRQALHRLRSHKCVEISRPLRAQKRLRGVIANPLLPTADDGASDVMCYRERWARSCLHPGSNLPPPKDRHGAVCTRSSKPTDTTYVSPSRVRRKSHYSCPTKLIHRSSAPTQRIHRQALHRLHVALRRLFSEVSYSSEHRGEGPICG